MAVICLITVNMVRMKLIIHQDNIQSKKGGGNRREWL